MKKILVVLLVAFIMIQFFPIDKTNPPLNPGMDFLKIKKHRRKLPISSTIHVMTVIPMKRNIHGIPASPHLHGC